MDLAIISMIMTAILGVITIVNFALQRKDKAVADTKDSDKSKSRDITSMESMKVQLDFLQEDMREMKQDMKEIKSLFITYKEDMRDIAREVVHDMVQSEIQSHVEKYHMKG